MKSMINTIMAITMAISSFTLYAQSSPELLIEGFRKTFKNDTEISAKLTEIENSVAIVLVPGILGSKLTSPTNGVIWGEGIPNIENIRLPPELVDENAESDVQASLLKSYFGDQYGEAFTRIQNTASHLGIKAIACGYDWRRDIRAGARDLEKCLQKEFGDKRHTLFFVSHSMGGLVTAVWNKNHELGKYGKSHLVGGLTMLGSPLGGSCEILRMINTGYVKPIEKDLAGNYIQYTYERTESWLNTSTNALTSFFTDGIRGALLTWPGAFELSPKPARIDTDRYCVLLRASEGDTDPKVVSFFDASFWQSPTASELLRDKKTPDHFDQVLYKAHEFRSDFEFSQPQAPVYVFYSTFWRTPESAIPRPGSLLSLSGDWHELEGDGRVPLVASRPDYRWLADFRNVRSIHGSLPKDSVFQKNFLDDRLKKLVSTMNAYRFITEVAHSPKIQALYADSGTPLPIPSVFVSSIEVLGTDDIEPKSPLTKKIKMTVAEFTQSLCNAGADCPSLKFAREETRNLESTADKKDMHALTKLGGVMFSENSTPLTKAQTMAQIGLAHARLGNIEIATGSLLDASREFASILPTTRFSENGQQQLENLQLTVDRNLVISLRETGQCKAAKALLTDIVKRINKHVSDLSTMCLDRESALYKELGAY